jgi:hypothetical protein
MKGRIVFLVLLTFFATPWRAVFGSNSRLEVARYEMKTTIPAIPAPAGACSGSTMHCVSLGWSAPTADINGNPVAGPLTYDVFRSTTSGTGYVKISAVPVSSLTFEDDNVVGGTTYFYVVVAYQTVNGTVFGPSANSNQVSATGLPIPGVPNPPTAPAAVSH